mgnify:FL=1
MLKFTYMSLLTKYIIASSVVLVTMMGMIYAFQFSRIERNLPLNEEQFNRLVDFGPPTKDFGSNNSVTTRADDFVALTPSDAPTKESGEQMTQSRSFFQRLFGWGDSKNLALNPAKETSVNTDSPFWIRLLERFDPFSLPTSPTKELSDARFAVKPLPTPPLPSPTPAPSTIGAPVIIPQPQQIVQVIEKIVERIIIREVERPVPTPVPVPTPAPSAKPAPSLVPSAETSSAIACSLQAFDNAVGGSSHTLIFRCDDPNVCSIAKDGESFIDVLGKGYFNFAGLSPANYKIRCGDKSRSWNSAISPFPTKPSYAQSGFRWFVNDDGEIPGRPLAEINQPMKGSVLPGNGQARLRLAVMANRVQVPRGDAKFKLQAALTTPVVGSAVNSSNVGGLCNNLPDGQYKDVQILDKVKFFDNPSVNDKVLMATRIDDPFYGIAIPQTYNETNSIVNLNAAIPADTPAIWDISLRLSPIGTGELMCFRLVRSDGLQLESYDVWPAVYSDR